MSQLGGIDPMFIYSETPASPMEVAYTCIFDPSTAPEAYSFEGIRERLSQRLPALVPFRRRLVEVPLGLAHPHWVDDPDFDLDNHLHRVALPAPGELGELSELAAEVMGRPLAVGQPPWEMHVVEGLGQGKVGLIAKLHHSVIDGVSGALLMAQLLDLTPDVPTLPDARRPWRPPALPSPARLVAGAIPSVLTTPVRALRALREVGRTAVGLAFHAADGGADAVSIPLGAPAHFPSALTAMRTVAFAEANLNEALSVKEHLGVTLNDIVLAACSGALRTYLVDHHGAPDAPLVAVVPVSVRPEREQAALGNRLSAMFVPLASDCEDRLDRLATVAAACGAAKAQERQVGYGRMASAVAEAVPPALAAPVLRLGAHLGAVRRLRPGNLVISNVPGPRAPLFFAGMQLESVFPIGPVVDGVALNITVQTYMDSLFVGLNACPTVVPDIEALARSVAGELELLVAAAEADGGSRRLTGGPARQGGDPTRSVPLSAARTPHALTPRMAARRPRRPTKRLAPTTG